MSAKQWLGQFLICIIIFSAAVGFVNYVMDPYGLYRFIDIKGLNQQKEGVRAKIRFVKALEISLRNPKTILMGSSRVHDSINPESKILKDLQPVYNYGLDMARIKEIKLYLNHAIINSSIKNVIIGLDFFMFNAQEKLNFTFDPSLVNREITSIDLYLKPLFLIASLYDSFNTFKVSSSQEDRMEFLENGYRPGESVFYKVRDYQKLHNYTNWVFTTTKPSKTLYYYKMTLDEEVFDDFKDILSLCRDHEINCKFYISPAHALLDGEGIRSAGLLPMFEDWKRKLAKISSDNDIALWDFSGYNSITTEKVKTPMKYYWDSSHFKEGVGDFILERILTENFSNKIIPNDFGTVIDQDNIEDHIKDAKRLRDDYVLENIEDTNKTLELYKNALSGAKLKSEYFEGMF